MHLNIAVHSELWLMSYVTASCTVLGFGSIWLVRFLNSAYVFSLDPCLISTA